MYLIVYHRYIYKYIYLLSYWSTDGLKNGIKWCNYLLITVICIPDRSLAATQTKLPGYQFQLTCGFKLLAGDYRGTMGIKKRWGLSRLSSPGTNTHREGVRTKHKLSWKMSKKAEIPKEWQKWKPQLFHEVNRRRFFVASIVGIRDNE